MLIFGKRKQKRPENNTHDIKEMLKKCTINRYSRQEYKISYLKKKDIECCSWKNFFGKKGRSFEFYSSEKHKVNKAFPTENAEVLKDDDLWGFLNIRNEISLFDNETKHF